MLKKIKEIFKPKEKPKPIVAEMSANMRGQGDIRQH